MAKRDFMSELAQEVEDKKNGRRTKIDGIDDFRPKKPIVRETVEETDAPAAPVENPDTENISAEETTKPQYTMDDAYDDEQGHPASYGQEERQKVDRPKLRLKPGVIIAGAVLLCVIIGVIIAVTRLTGRVTVGDFVGKDISQVTNWAKQNKMDSSSIAKTEEYSLEYAKDVVIEQSAAAGEKIRTSTPFTVVVSLGPDPNEEIDFPSDLKSMTMSEIKEWVSENQLSKTKITTQYSDIYEDGAVISYELKNVSESDFTRGSTLNIVCSKGPTPTGQVTMENYVGKTYTEMQTWAANKKLVLDKQETYSDSVASGYIISVDKKTGESVAEGSTIVVVVSKGKGVKIPDLVGYTSEQLEAWKVAKDNSVVVVTKSIYNENAAGTVLSQSISPGTIVDSGEVLELTISLYLPIMEKTSNEWLGKDYLELKAWVDEVNSKGASIQAGQYGDYQWNICSDEYPTAGQIIDYGCLYGTSDLADGCGRPLNLNSRIAYTVSTGACSVKQIVLQKANMTNLAMLQAWCAANHISFSVDEYATDEGPDDATVWFESTDGQEVNNGSYQVWPIVLQDYAYLQIHWKAEIPSTPTPSATAETAAESGD